MIPNLPPACPLGHTSFVYKGWSRPAQWQVMRQASHPSKGFLTDHREFRLPLESHVLQLTLGISLEQLLSSLVKASFNVYVAPIKLEQIQHVC